MTAPEASGEARLYLPDFCAQRPVLAVVLIVELTAIVLTLARSATGLDFWSDLARASMFLLWIGLAAAGVLCWLRRRLATQSVARAAWTVLALMGALVALIAELAYRLGQLPFAAPDGLGGIFPQDHAAFIARSVAIGWVVTALALRYFYVTQQWRRNVELQARARVNALQARIRPHFLFNSMNTIASLTRSNPARAEEAVQDLADLFRATLSDKRREITFAEELEVARTYQRIEQLRLGERLQVNWKIDALPARALVPGLMLQPLLENAIYHGIEPLAAGGTVTVSGELANGLITLIVRNPVTGAQTEHDGNRLALGNIRERLALMYGERAALKAGRFDSEFIVTLRFPHIESAARLRA
ncbi:MAG: histidine kinase [Steroidobacteraceae bacterium]